MRLVRAFGNIATTISLLLLAGALPLFAQGERPPQGLMWNRTGLPAVFPLQVKTRPGKDYLLLLTSVDTGADVLAAYFVGGKFFRVLVPPGSFRVRFASGREWESEDTLFGRNGETEIIELPEALTFEVRGLGVKSGHLIDLTDVAFGQMAQIPVAPVRICQDVDRIPQDWFELHTDWIYFGDPDADPLENRGRYLDIRSRYCWE